MTTTKSSLRLADGYREREDPGELSHNTLVATIEGLEAQLHSLYEERSTTGYLSAETSADRLGDLGGDREMHHGDGSPDRFGPFAALAQAALGLVQQIEVLSEEHSEGRFNATEANQMVDSLEAQVAALLEERDSLAAGLEFNRMENKIHRDKARALMAAVVEQALG